MRRFWLFRSNIRNLEYYHEYKDLKTFEENCHDFYLLFPLQLLKDDYFDEIIIWRLTKQPQPDIIFNVNGKKFIQKWVKSFNECFTYPKPSITFFRGGFKEYDLVVKENKKHFGMTLYLGAGARISPQYGGKYDYILLEDENELKTIPNSLPFYKTASNHIFKPLNLTKIYDVCWPCNFTQQKYKGQEFFISTVGACSYLKKLKIIHIGNKPKIGKRMCENYNVQNIEFNNIVDRIKLNEIMNQSKIGLVTSNRKDGCPRISTEILMSGTPLAIRKSTRLLSHFKQRGVMQFNDKKMIKNIKTLISKYKEYENDLLIAIENELSFKSICELNINIWLTKLGDSILK